MKTNEDCFGFGITKLVNPIFFHKTLASMVVK